MEQIAQAFREEFKPWNLEIPQEALSTRTAGFIQEAGWLIQYLFGKDSQGEYLDYYASHRMTDDRHVRLYETGQQKDLDALDSFYITSSDPEEAKRREAAYFERNRIVAEQLAAKGFDKLTINMALHSGLVGNDTDRDEEES